MTAMNKPPDSHSDSEDSDSSQPPPSTSHVRSPHSKPKSPTYQPNIKSKRLSLKIKMRRTSPRKPLSTSNISPSYPVSVTPPVLENGTSPPPPPNYNLHINPQNNSSPRHFQLPPLSSPPYFDNSPLPDDTNCDNFSNDSPIHNVWQSTKVYPLLHHLSETMIFR